MPRNVEIKAKIRDFEIAKANIQNHCGQEQTLLRQKDTYYRIRNGRLKIRETPAATELIYYQRTNTRGPKLSRYYRKRLLFPAAVRRILALLLGVRGVVEKERLLFFCGRTRIHLDKVRELGQFIEFEVVLEKSEPLASGRAEAGSLLERLGIASGDLVSESYIELLEARGEGIL